MKKRIYIIIILLFFLLYIFNLRPKYETNILSFDPSITYIKNFISQEEAEHLIKLGEEKKQQSMVDDSNPIQTEMRSSNSAFLNKSQDNIVKSIEKRAANYLKINRDRLEPLQVVIYTNKQEYRPHHDYFTPDSKLLGTSGNRTDTILLYLNDLDEEDGGSTYFPKLNLRVKPKALDAIHFVNMKNGNVDENTLHAGEPILTDKTKYAINIWVRENKFE